MRRRKESNGGKECKGVMGNVERDDHVVGLGDRIHYGIWKKVRVVGHGASKARDKSERQSGADAGIILNHR